MTERELEMLESAYTEIEKNGDLTEKDPYRMHYHIMPPVGLINDPNGFIHWNGTYHLFYQWMPFHTGHGTKFWGHVSSTDLVHWKHEPIALAPSEWYEQNGCYSGCAIAHEDKLVLFYTGNVKDDDGNRETYQCIAESTDGTTFTKLGPVIYLPEGYTSHFRDPKVWNKDGVWYLIIGAQNEKLEGKAVLFRSNDLKEWELLGDVTGSKTEYVGEFGYMWECPDLFHLHGKEVLVVSPQGVAPDGMLYHNEHQCGYLVGELDYENVKFRHEAFIEMDRGFEFYAPQTMQDDSGQRILVAWMGMPDQYEQQHPTIPYKWIHNLTLPRELHLQGNKLLQTPIKELEDLRGEEILYEHVSLQNEEAMFEGIEGDVLELQLNGITGDYRLFEMTFRGNMRLLYHKENRLLTLERKNFANGQTEARHCRLETLDSLRIYVDKSSVEIFINNGEEVFSSRLFSYSQNQEYTFAAKGEALFNLRKWDLAKSVLSFANRGLIHA